MIIFTAKEYGSGTTNVGIEIYTSVSPFDENEKSHYIDLYVDGIKKESWEDVSYSKENGNVAIDLGYISQGKWSIYINAYNKENALIYSGNTNGAGSHSHKVVSSKDKTITIHNALKIGDKVALIRKTGGQSYFILDKI